MIYWELFLSFFQIGLFSFGGGYVTISLIQSQIVDIKHWITLTEFTDLITISQMTPGPIGINSATFVGSQISGIMGSLVATAGFVLPSCIISISLAYLYGKYKDLRIIKGIFAGLRPAVVGLIVSALIPILSTSLWGISEFWLDIFNIDFIAFTIFLVGIIALKKFKVNQLFVLAGSGVIGGAIYLLLGK